jgi:nucleoside-diphosphate-sugar epimerase
MALPSYSNLLLITGATGHVGFCTLLHALKAGYSVRAAVRSVAKADLILSRPQIQALNPGSRLSFTIVPDITAPSAYDAAVRGVRYIIHIASPLVTGDTIPLSQHRDYFIRPAVQGTVGMLDAARKAGTVRRVVITSSIAALMPVWQMEGIEPRTCPVRPTDRTRLEEEPYETEFAAYAASKIAALQAAEAWIRTESPSFGVTHLHPSFVVGRNDLANTPVEAMKGTNAVVLAMLLGKKFGPFAGATVHVEDVARVHVEALSPTTPSNCSYILSQPARWNDAKEMVKRDYPEVMEKRLLVGTGSVDTTVIPVDSSLTERTFGFTFQPYEAQVRSVVGHYLELRSRKRPGAVQAMSRAGISAYQHVAASA